MTKIQIEKDWKSRYRRQKAIFCNKLDEQRNKWSIATGGAFLLGIVLGQTSQTIQVMRQLGEAVMK